MNIGIIGFGYMGKWHYTYLKKYMTIDKIYIFDNDPNIEKLSKTIYDVIICKSVEQLINIQEINTIIISTPNDTHASYIKMALNGKKNVICEKPVTIDYDTFIQLETLSKEKGLIFTVHQNRRWDIDFLTIQSVLNSGVLGNIIKIESRIYAQRGLMYGWRSKKEFGGGMILDWGPHLIDQMLILQNCKVSSIYSEIKSIMTKTVDDYFSIKLKFENDVICLIEAGTFALRKLPRWFIYGDRGTLIIDDLTGQNGGITYLSSSYSINEIELMNIGGTSRLLSPILDSQTINIEFPLDIKSQENEFYNNYFDAINKKARPHIKLSQIKRVMKIIDLSRVSAKNNDVIITSI